MEQLKFYELLIMSVEEYPHIYDKTEVSYKDEIMVINNRNFEEWS